MVAMIFSYLLESSLCLIIFMAMYRVLISNLTHFSWMRFYLNCSLLLSLLLPLIIIPVQWKSGFLTEDSLVNGILPVKQSQEIVVSATVKSNETVSMFSWSILLLYSFFAIYIGGVIYKALSFAKNLKKIYRFITTNPKVKESNYWIVSFTSEIPAFSFFNYIFINKNFKNLSDKDFQIIKDHELIHVNQYHTIDVMFTEVGSVFFWFNPALVYLKKSLLEIHEYIVDEKVAGEGENKKAYANLLLTLASETKLFTLVTTFTGEHIMRRIQMIARPRTSAMSKILFVILVPITAILLLSFSYVKYKNPNAGQKTKQQLSCELKIREISWKGNVVFSTDTLNKRLGLKSGDNYIAEDLKKQITNGEVQSLYLNKGYAFYNAEVFEHSQKNGQIDLTITVNEGVVCKVGTISVKGNKKVPTNEILDKVLIKTGELFNKTKIHNSLVSIVSIGKFDAEKISITPTPDPEKSTKDLAVLNLIFEVSEINKK